MLELTQLDKNYFNYQFLKFRTQYYFNETKELIARHKLLTAFIICLLAPGVKNIQAIGIPFYALIDPSITFKAKFIYLVTLLFFLLSLTRAQSSFIKGGAFREYLHTLYIPLRVHNFSTSPLKSNKLDPDSTPKTDFEALKNLIQLLPFILSFQFDEISVLTWFSINLLQTDCPILHFS